MMKTEEKIKAVKNRDASYRDKFFVAVRTTKIVCTPDCPAKPLEKNIVFYDTLEEALQAGYRPCKICMKEFHNNKRNNMETIKITRYQSPVGADRVLRRQAVYLRLGGGETPQYDRPPHTAISECEVRRGNFRRYRTGDRGTRRIFCRTP